MKLNENLKILIDGFSELYWLKPVDIVWDSVTAFYIQEKIGNDEVILDLGCGDGLYSLLMFGGELKLDYDRFLNVKPDNQTIGSNQFGDIYSDPMLVDRLKKAPRRYIDYGLELKQHHINVAESLGIYKKIYQGCFEDIPLPDEKIDKVYSIFAFYWGDDLEKQFKEVNRILTYKGEFFVNLPSEHLYDLHLAKKISEDMQYSKPIRDYMTRLDGGRRKLATRYGRSIEHWREYIEKCGFEVKEALPVVNELMFTLQDFAQRPFLPMFFEMSNRKDFQEFRNSAKKYLCKHVYPSLINEMMLYEGNQDIRHGYYLFKLIKKQ